MKSGDVYKTQFGDLTVLEYTNAKNVKVRFASGYETVTRAEHIRNSTVKDRMHHLLYGVGVSTGASNTKAYTVWADILRRCYDNKSKSYHRYGGRGVRCCDEWLIFGVFEKWYNDNYIEGFELDKDILFPDAKLYSPSSCIFVPKRINSALTLSNRGRGDLPVGVSYFKGRTKCFCAGIKIDGVKKNLGYYFTKEEAFFVYKQNKEAEVRKIADVFFENNQITVEVRDALYRWTVGIND